MTQILDTSTVDFIAARKQAQIRRQVQAQESSSGTAPSQEVTQQVTSTEQGWISTENVQSSESTNQLRNTAERIIKSFSQSLNSAYTHAQHRNDLQIASDLDIIRKFTDNDPTIKAAMGRLANIQGDSDRYIQQTANLIKINPQIKQFYESTVPSSSQTDQGNARAESGPSQDTDDITQKRHSFLDTIPDKTITDLAEKLRTIPSKKRDLDSFKLARDACNKIKLFRELYTKGKNQAEKAYGSITKDQAANAALDLRNALNQDDLIRTSFTATYRTKMNQYYQDAGLS